MKPDWEFDFHKDLTFGWKLTNMNDMDRIEKETDKRE